MSPRPSSSPSVSVAPSSSPSISVEPSSEPTMSQQPTWGMRQMNANFEAAIESSPGLMDDRTVEIAEEVALQIFQDFFPSYEAAQIDFLFVNLERQTWLGDFNGSSRRGRNLQEERYPLMLVFGTVANVYPGNPENFDFAEIVQKFFVDYQDEFDARLTASASFFQPDQIEGNRVIKNEQKANDQSSIFTLPVIAALAGAAISIFVIGTLVVRRGRREDNRAFDDIMMRQSNAGPGSASTLVRNISDEESGYLVDDFDCNKSSLSRVPLTSVNLGSSDGYEIELVSKKSSSSTRDVDLPSQKSLDDKTLCTVQQRDNKQRMKILSSTRGEASKSRVEVIPLDGYLATSKDNSDTDGRGSLERKRDQVRQQEDSLRQRFNEINSRDSRLREAQERPSIPSGDESVVVAPSRQLRKDRVKTISNESENESSDVESSIFQGLPDTVGSPKSSIFQGLQDSPTQGKFSDSHGQIHQQQNDGRKDHLVDSKQESPSVKSVRPFPMEATSPNWVNWGVDNVLGYIHVRPKKEEKSHYSFSWMSSNNEDDSLTTDSAIRTSKQDPPIPSDRHQSQLPSNDPPRDGTKRISTRLEEIRSSSRAPTSKPRAPSHSRDSKDPIDTVGSNESSLDPPDSLGLGRSGRKSIDPKGSVGSTSRDRKRQLTVHERLYPNEKDTPEYNNTSSLNKVVKQPAPSKTKSQESNIARSVRIAYNSRSSWRKTPTKRSLTRINSDSKKQKAAKKQPEK